MGVGLLFLGEEQNLSRERQRQLHVPGFLSEGSRGLTLQKGPLGLVSLVLTQH